MKLYIFDVDGVLDNDKPLLDARLKQQLLAVSNKHSISFDEAIKLRKKTKDSLSETRKHTSFYLLEALGFSRQEYFDIINSVNPTGLIEPSPHLDILNLLRKENRVVAYSNTPHDALIKTLHILGVVNYFHKIYSVEDFSESKPSPMIIQHILDDQGFTKENAINIGNSYEKDVVPAKRVGVRTVLYDAIHKYDNKPTPMADHVIFDLIELKTLCS